MKPETIIEGCTYRGKGTIYLREVVFILEIEGYSEKRVAWCSMNTLPAYGKNGWVRHQPHGICNLSTFAKWAQEKISNAD